MINLIFINIAVVYLIDQSGGMDSLKSLIKRLLTNGKMKGSDYSLKPFDCSKCMTFWASIGYLLFISELSIFTFMLACVSSFAAQFTNEIFNIIKIVFIKLTNKL